jgi:ABC-type lipoprotein release transport system permease subunit
MRIVPPPRPGEPPVHLPPTRYEVVGVVEDVRNAPLGQAVEPALYFSTRQFPFREVVVAVRARDTGAALSAIRTALNRQAPGVPTAMARTWGERLAARTGQSRLLMTILVVFAVLAALLAALGVYGLFSWSVALRKRELAIRLTLGARPASVGRLVVAQGIALVGAGVLAGLGLIALVRGALTRVLYEVTPDDPASIVLAIGVLLAAAIVACGPPAWRAMRVDPVEGLRAE